MKFSLKWGIANVCRLINTGNIEQNVFYVKRQFLRFCNFFHKKIAKAKLLDFANMMNSKVRDSIAIFSKLNHKDAKKYTYDHFKIIGMSKAGIYKILARFDERGNVDCQCKTGRSKG